MPFEQYLQSRILTPLGMRNTSIREDLPPDLASRLTEGYSFAHARNVPVPDEIIVFSPSGSMSSTSPDMARFMIAHLQNGTYGNATILSDRTAAEMHTRAFTNDPRAAGVCLGFYEQYYNGIITAGGRSSTPGTRTRSTPSSSSCRTSRPGSLSRATVPGDEGYAMSSSWRSWTTITRQSLRCSKRLILPLLPACSSMPVRTR